MSLDKILIMLLFILFGDLLFALEPLRYSHLYIEQNLILNVCVLALISWMAEITRARDE
jgi:hypothetical protein